MIKSVAAIAGLALSACATSPVEPRTRVSDAGEIDYTNLMRAAWKDFNLSPVNREEVEQIIREEGLNMLPEETGMFFPENIALSCHNPDYTLLNLQSKEFLPEGIGIGFNSNPINIPIDSNFLDQVSRVFQNTTHWLNEANLDRKGWLTVQIHWTHHLKEVGIDPWDLIGAKYWLWDVVNNPESQIFYRQGAGALQEAYTFATKIGDKTWYTIISAENGAPISTHALNDDGVRDLANRIVKEGLVAIQRENLGNGIQRWLGDKPPSTTEILYWSMRYHFLKWVATKPGLVSFGQFVEEVAKGRVTPGPMLIVPSMYLFELMRDCPPGGPCCSLGDCEDIKS